MRITWDFEDLGPNTIAYETEEEQRAVIETEEGVPVLYVNRPACRFLARLFAQLGHQKLDSGFHLHLGRDLDTEAEEMFRIVLDDETSS